MHIVKREIKRYENVLTGHWCESTGYPGGQFNMCESLEIKEAVPTALMCSLTYFSSRKSYKLVNFDEGLIILHTLRFVTGVPATKYVHMMYS